MHNFNRTRTPSESESINNLSILEDYVDTLSYVKWVGADEFYGGAVMGLDGSVAVREFNDAISTEVTYTFKRPSQWKDGKAGIKIWYTGTNVSGGDIRIVHSIESSKRGVAIPAFLANSSVNLLPTPDPSDSITAYNCMEQGVSNLFTVTEDMDILSLNLRRAGAGAGDDYTDTFKLIGVQIIYKERTRAFTSKLNTDRRYP